MTVSLTISACLNVYNKKIQLTGTLRRMTEITEQNTVSEKFVPKPDLPPPPNTTGAIGWLRYNLFDGFLSSCLTVLSL